MRVSHNGLIVDFYDARQGCLASSFGDLAVFSYDCPAITGHDDCVLRGTFMSMADRETQTHPACVVIMSGFIMQSFIMSGFHAESHPELPETEYAGRATTARWRLGL
jgi:hypothetical protein